MFSMWRRDRVITTYRPASQGAGDADGGGGVMNECKSHRYSVEGEITDAGCPYCEIDRLTAQLDASRILLAERDEEIRNKNHSLIELNQKVDDMREQLSRFRQQQVAELQQDVEGVRKQTAREIILMMTGATFEGPNAAKFEKVTEAFIGQILRTYGLEG